MEKSKRIDVIAYLLETWGGSMEPLQEMNNETLLHLFKYAQDMRGNMYEVQSNDGHAEKARLYHISNKRRKPRHRNRQPHFGIHRRGGRVSERN
jgi:hypothetical protein